MYTPSQNTLTTSTQPQKIIAIKYRNRAKNIPSIHETFFKNTIKKLITTINTIRYTEKMASHDQNSLFTAQTAYADLYIPAHMSVCLY